MYQEAMGQMMAAAAVVAVTATTAAAAVAPPATTSTPPALEEGDEKREEGSSEERGVRPGRGKGGGEGGAERGEGGGQKEQCGQGGEGAGGTNSNYVDTPRRAAELGGGDDGDGGDNDDMCFAQQHSMASVSARGGTDEAEVAGRTDGLVTASNAEDDTSPSMRVSYIRTLFFSSSNFTLSLGTKVRTGPYHPSCFGTQRVHRTMRVL